MVKNKIRKSLLKQGQLLSSNSIKKINYKIQRTALDVIDIKESKNTLLYFPYRNEISIDIIIKELLKYSNNIYMPRIVSENTLKFNKFLECERLEKNKFGINEIINEDYINPESFNTMFIPFVGIDINGYRLGYGGGFFDRTLKKLESKKNKPLFIGLGYDYQILDETFGESHDIKYDLIITESRILSFNWAIKYATSDGKN